jgi:hypothetical protein
VELRLFCCDNTRCSIISYFKTVANALRREHSISTVMRDGGCSAVRSPAFSDTLLHHDNASFGAIHSQIAVETSAYGLHRGESLPQTSLRLPQCYYFVAP